MRYQAYFVQCRWVENSPLKWFESNLQTSEAMVHFSGMTSEASIFLHKPHRKAMLIWGLSNHTGPGLNSEKRKKTFFVHIQHWAKQKRRYFGATACVLDRRKSNCMSSLLLCSMDDHGQKPILSLRQRSSTVGLFLVFYDSDLWGTLSGRNGRKWEWGGGGGGGGVLCSWHQNTTRKE